MGKFLWFNLGALSYQLLQFLIVLTTGENSEHWALILRGYL